jgi:hypothetical protein
LLREAARNNKNKPEKQTCYFGIRILTFGTIIREGGGAAAGSTCTEMQVII